MSSYLKHITDAQLNSLLKTRKGEIKLGETINRLQSLSELKSSSATHILLGIEEDIGIRANLGFPGSKLAWTEFISAFLNHQSNRFFNGDEVAILGSLEFTDWQEKAELLKPSSPADLVTLRDLTNSIDKVVSSLVYEIVDAGKIPIVVGGGHNNSYPIIKGVSQAIEKPLNVLNIDPHTDYRQREGRHSGNGFRYAREEGFLTRYAVFGLSEAYNVEGILTEFDQDQDLNYTSFESLLHLDSEARVREWHNTIQWLGNEALGIELDTDSITGFPSSAYNPSGFSLNEVRSYLCQVAAFSAPHYLHIAEASPGRAETLREKSAIGVSLAYLVSDFIKSQR